HARRCRTGGKQEDGGERNESFHGLSLDCLGLDEVWAFHFTMFFVLIARETRRAHTQTLRAPKEKHAALRDGF
ncbi:hypothetical protein, partial [Cardiobacterium hominis]|uniref:hypothetical protein n=1 Tax=Cardiobacterium hominis TaxID=2718 RepID=UPI0028EEA8C8